MSNLHDILAGFTGSITIVGETFKVYGGPVGQEIGATFIILNGVIVEGIKATEGTSDGDYGKLEAACVQILTGLGLGVAVMAVAGEGVLAIVAAGVVAIAVEKSSEPIYEAYKNGKEMAFELFSALEVRLMEPRLMRLPEILIVSLTSGEKGSLMPWTPSRLTLEGTGT